MPNIKSAKKRVKTDAIKKERNRDKIASMRTAMKKVRIASKQGDKNLAEENLKVANKKIDKAVKSGLVHKNKVDREKSRLTLKVNKIEVK